MCLSKDHYINLKNGAFDSTSKAELDHLFTSLSDSPNRATLVVHFHGGLVGEKAGMNVACRLLPVYQSAGGYPVFFVWESGLLEVLTHNLGEISQERIFQLLLRKVAQFAVAKLTQPAGARAAGYLELPTESDVNRELGKLQYGEGPYASLDMIALPVGEVLRDTEEQQFQDLIVDADIEDEVYKIANSFRPIQDIDAEREATRGARVQGSTRTLMSPDIIDEVRREELATGASRGILTMSFVVKHSLAILKRTVARFAGQHSHGVYATIVEELLREFYIANIGEFVWTEMKKDTEDAFQNDAQKYGGTAFLEGIKAHWLEVGCPRIVLIGHSTGAVYICHFLKHAQQRLPPEVKFEVVFLAPACTFNLLSTTLQASAARLKDIRVIGLSDSLEKADQLVPVIYPHSLLYFISGILEKEADTPILGMQRFYSGAPPFDASNSPEVYNVRDFLVQQEGRTVWSVASSGPGRASRAAGHTEFDEERDTVGSLQHIITQGL